MMQRHWVQVRLCRVKEENRFEQEPAEDGYLVFFEQPHPFSPQEIEAELPDGTRVASVLQLGGRRLGFDRPLPQGSWILRKGARTWGPVGLGPDHGG